MNKDFEEWACSLSGCDGGNLAADIWFCGIEYGSASANEGEYYKNLKEEIEKGKSSPETSYDWKLSLKYSYGRTLAKLYRAIKGGDPRIGYGDYISDNCNGSEIFALNLYPIAFDSTSVEHWKANDLDKLIGFNEKHLYQTWCMLNRFPGIAKIREDRKPKLIVCAGVSYLREFLLCFGGWDKNHWIESADLEPKEKDTNPYIRKYYWIKLSGGTTLVVVPFFSGRYGLNSDYLIGEMGGKLRELAGITTR